MRQPFIVGVGGLTSNVGKTTLMCELLRAFPGWEAIKTTRGHYRSCGKDPEACCVSHLLAEEPLVRSGKVDTYEPGKDTARYWDAGASNVHWLIASEDQIERGINEALTRVRSEGVFVEGNSFSQFVRTDYFVMVKRGARDDIKKSARVAMPMVSSVFVFDPIDATSSRLSFEGLNNGSPIPISPSLPVLVSQLRIAMAERKH